MNNSKQPAFPEQEYDKQISNAKQGTVVYKQIHGLTKLEYFAGLAMQGLLSNEAVSHDIPMDVSKKAILHAQSLLHALKYEI